MFNTNNIVAFIALIIALLAIFANTNSPAVGTSYDRTTFTNPITFSDAVTHSGTTTFSGAIASTGGILAKRTTETITADDTLTTGESFKVISIGTAGVDLTLPTANSATGTTYRVVVSANFSTTSMTVTGPASDATDDTIYGALEVAGAVVACSAEDTITFVHTAELPGDFIELYSDGAKWYITGQGTTAGSITCTDAD